MDAGGGIQPVGRRTWLLPLKASKTEPATFSQSTPAPSPSFYRLELDSLQVAWLLHPDIDGAANSSNFLGYGIGHLLVDYLISANDLDVKGGGKSEVKGLAYDVGRQEVEGYPEEIAVKAETKVAHVIRCRFMSGF